MNIHARLSQSLCVGCGKLLAGQTKLTRRLSCRNSELTKLASTGLCQLFRGQAKLRALLRGSHTGLSLLLDQATRQFLSADAKLCGLTRKLTLQLRRRHAQLTCQLLGALSKLTGLGQIRRGKLFGGQLLLTRRCLRRQPELAELTSLGRCQLLGRKAKLARCLSGLKSSTSALSAEGPGKLCGLLAARLLGFECLLCALCRAFKPGLTHLSGSSALLFHYVASQFGFRNRLARPAKRACANGLGTKLLLLDLTRTSDVSQSLLNRRIFIGVHERANLTRLEGTCRSRQTSNALLCRAGAQSTGSLQSAGCIGSDAASPGYSLLATGQGAFICPDTACPGLLSREPRCIRYAAEPCRSSSGTQTCAETSLRGNIRAGKPCGTQSLRPSARGLSCALDSTGGADACRLRCSGQPFLTIKRLKARLVGGLKQVLLCELLRL